MATCFSALGDEDIRSRRRSLLGERGRLDLADDDCSGALDPVNERPGRPEGKHDRRGCALQSNIEEPGLLRQAPCDKSDAEARFRSVEQIEFAHKPLLFAVATA
jgi:hypothetical protein